MVFLYCVLFGHKGYYLESGEAECKRCGDITRPMICRVLGHSVRSHFTQCHNSDKVLESQHCNRCQWWEHVIHEMKDMRQEDLNRVAINPFDTDREIAKKYGIPAGNCPFSPDDSRYEPKSNGDLARSTSN